MKWLWNLLPFLKGGVSIASGFLGSPLFLVSIGIAALSAGGAGYVGYQYASGQCAKDEVSRLELLEEIRSVNLELANGIATRTEEAIGKIRINHRTVIQPEIRHEREIHKVLQDPNCGVPQSTIIRVLNPARGYIDRGPPASQPNRPVRPAAAPADGEAPPPG